MSVLNNRTEMQLHLRQFKDRGAILFNRLLAIPTHQRIPALISEYGLQKMTENVAGIIGLAMNSMNLRKGMNDDQLIDLAMDILDEASEDNLAMEDLLLFLQQLVRGKKGTIYDRMDATVFFGQFEKYREERYISLLRLREEQAANHKAAGDARRTSQDLEYDLHRAAMGYYLKKQYGTDQGTDQPNSPTGT